MRFFGPHLQYKSLNKVGLHALASVVGKKAQSGNLVATLRRPCAYLWSYYANFEQIEELPRCRSRSKLHSESIGAKPCRCSLTMNYAEPLSAPPNISGHSICLVVWSLEPQGRL